MWHDLLLALLGGSFLGLVYTYVGYPALIFLLGRLRRSPVAAAEYPFEPRVSVVMAVHNEQDRITVRLQNLLSSDYSSDKLEIILVTDGSTDRTAEIAERLQNPRIRVLRQPLRQGKATCVNIGVAAASGEVVILCDVRQRFASDTIRRLVEHFRDPANGAVSGDLTIEKSSTGVGAGVDSYWKLEKMIRYYESAFDSSIGCTGAVYAVRKSLYKPLPADTLLDDVVTPMEIAMQGYRVRFDRDALAFDPQSLEPEKEKVRKQRTLAGNFQMLFRYLPWLFPWKNRLWWQLASHKYCRLICPALLVSMFVSNALLIQTLSFRILFAGQCLFYALAIVGRIFRSKFKPLSIAAGFVFLNVMVVQGFRHYMLGSYKGQWPLVKS